MQAHWDKAIQIEDTLTRAAEAQAAYDALRPAAQPVLAWPYNHLRLAVSSAKSKQQHPAHHLATSAANLL
jgi:hypothetical protein